MKYAHLDHIFEGFFINTVISMGLVNKEGNVIGMELDKFVWKPKREIK